MTGETTETTLDALMLGPIDILVLEFPSTDFKGDILSNLYELVAAGTIRIIDLLIVAKSKTGLISALESADLGSAVQDALAPLRAHISQLLTNDDVIAIGRELDNDSTAAVLLYENTWAVRTKKAIMEANGRMIACERIPHDIVVQSLEDLVAMK